MSVAYLELRNEVLVAALELVDDKPADRSPLGYVLVLEVVTTEEKEVPEFSF